MNENGSIQTNIQTDIIADTNQESDETLPAKAPVPFIKSLNSKGEMEMGFDPPIAVPKDLDLEALNKKEVALRWTQAKDVFNETYLTPDGYRDFEIHRAIELSLELSPDVDETLYEFEYEVISFTENGLTFNITFENPDYISSAGFTTDSMKVTFWDTSLLVG